MMHRADETEVAADPAVPDSAVPHSAVQEDRNNRPDWWAAATGLNAAIVVSYLACKPPETHTLSLRTRFLASAFYILLTCLAGTAGTWIALSRRTRKQLRGLVLTGLRGWIFLPAIMMFLRERSVWAVVIAALSAAFTAVYFTRSSDIRDLLTEDSRPQVEKNIFITQLRFKPISSVSFAVSFCLCGALLSAANEKLALLTLLLGASAFLLVSQITTTHPRPEREPDLPVHRGTQPYSWIAAAFFCAFIALSVASGTSDSVWKLRAFHVLEHAVAKPVPTPPRPPEQHFSSGYQIIVLWPVEKKEKVLPSPPSTVHASSPGMAKQWIIPFYGPYWYFKIPGQFPGPKASITHGDPLKVNVRSTDADPLLMEAHQNLPTPIDLSCCSEIQVVFKNDQSLGASDIGLSLTDTRTAGKPSQSLGIKYVASDAIDLSSAPTSPTEETVTFPLPKSAKIKKFDQMTVLLLPGANHRTAGRKVAVEKFILIPN